jgi:ribonuclease H-related protein
MSSKKKKYYAYLVPNGPRGVADDWKTCERVVSGKVGARFRSFEERGDAERWLMAGARYETRMRSVRKPKPGVYFDAGTGRGEGVEISVTDEKGKNLLHKALSKNELNRFGKHLVGDASATNNYGELLALRYALAIAKKGKMKKVFGDSKLVIEYWSRWHIHRKTLPEETVELAEEVSRMLVVFEKKGGSVDRISGENNPADLGFHR